MKGTINENIVDMLNLRPLEEVLQEKGVTPEAPQEEPQTEVALRDLSAKLAMIEGTDHGESMDEMHVEILQHARDLMAYGYNIDHPRARGIFEIAAVLYSHAITAKNSKRDAQLKSMKLALDKKRIELEEKRTNHQIGQALTDSDGTIMVEDRNELLRRIRQQAKGVDK